MWKWPDSSYAFELLVRQESDQVLREGTPCIGEVTYALGSKYTAGFDIYKRVRLGKLHELVYKFAVEYDCLEATLGNTLVRMQQIRGAVERGAHTWKLEWRA